MNIVNSENITIFKDFIEKYWNSFSNDSKVFLMNQINNGELILENGMMQSLLYATNILEKNHSWHYEFVQYILNNYGAVNIIEIGTGYYPDTAILLDEEFKKLGKGSIKAYDPKIIPLDYPFPIFKELFTEDTDLKNIDLIIAFAPCHVEKLVYETANLHGIDFCYADCGCKAKEYSFDYYRHLEILRRETIALIRKTLPIDKEFIFDRMSAYGLIDKEYAYPHPVFATKKLVLEDYS